MSSILTLNLYAQEKRNCAYVNLKSNRENNEAKRTADGRILYIPVVFHVVYNSASQNITDDQIYSQLAVINEDFSKTNEDTSYTIPEFKAVAAKAGIQFYIAQAEGDRGITRTSTTHLSFFNDDLHRTDLGGTDGWDSQKYLNVWVASLAPGIFGYGTSPGTPAFRDGVVVHYEYFGRHTNAVAPYNLGRTLTHEIGHWLGLQHPWGFGGCNSDDGLTDTPPQYAATSGCVLNQASCGTLNMVQNFMNTSDDACMNLFTLQQCELMRNTLIVSRPGAYSDQQVITAVDQKISRSLGTLYPNPVTGEPFIIVLVPPANNFLQISLTDIYGRTLRNYCLFENASQIKINLEGLSNGVYIARISNNQLCYSAKIYLNINQ